MATCNFYAHFQEEDLGNLLGNLSENLLENFSLKTLVDREITGGHPGTDGLGHWKEGVLCKLREKSECSRVQCMVQKENLEKFLNVTAPTESHDNQG